MGDCHACPGFIAVLVVDVLAGGAGGKGAVEEGSFDSTEGALGVPAAHGKSAMVFGGAGAGGRLRQSVDEGEEGDLDTKLSGEFS